MSITPNSSSVATLAERRAAFRARRENTRQAAEPKDLILHIPKDSVNPKSRDTFIVTMNPHVSCKDSIIPYRDKEHPDGRFHSLDKAKKAAAKLFEKYKLPLQQSGQAAQQSSGLEKRENLNSVKPNCPSGSR